MFTKGFLAASLLAFVVFSTPASADVQPADFGRVPADHLERQAVHRRAVEAVVWGLPAVNFELMYQAATQSGGGWNEIVYWSRPLTWMNQTLTPNPDTIYLMSFFNTMKVGPVVLEIPPAGEGTITGSIDDAWQTAVEDVGPAGADKGKGGKYLILPPGYDGMVPEGYFPLRPSTFTGFALLRSNLKSRDEAEVVNAVAYGKRIKLYPLSQENNMPGTTFVDAIDLMYDATIRYDLSFFETLDLVVQREPWLERDKVMIDQLVSLGIEKGKPFQPDEERQIVLKDAVVEAQRWIDARYEAAFVPFFEGTRWGLPISPDVIEGMSTNFANPNSYPVTARGVMYSIGYFSAKHLGAGQFYLMTTKDRKGEPLDGASTYRLTVPPNAPVELYWSVTAYDRDTHALIKNRDRASRASNSGDLQANPDGSTHIYFGPEPPEGNVSNWIPSDPDRRFELMLRVYGPKKEFFEKAWKLPDVEKVGTRREK
ncbi:DUF1254 domain-containing protein [Rhizobium wenxiniae]|uniref:DUF1254 domain-containing protein n=1 Tax=Rhizobium wenxiniae TaxID=1737357 RepID=UPI001C6E687F|nr:DUF1254 domain-containing protein [Rhizobium wenxiniae]MBW9091910.1 DUF1254 domain-containing protein [Rhizobium wenxiniae]